MCWNSETEMKCKNCGKAYTGNASTLEMASKFFGLCDSCKENIKKCLTENCDKSLDDFAKFIEAEGEAFKKAGIKTGRVEFTCPVCGGKAVGIRELHRGRISGMGSGCSGCNMNHT